MNGSMPTPSPIQNSTAHTRSKYACTRCKKFKRKCDGKPWIKPCSSCTKAKLECSMMKNDDPQSTDKFTYIRMLEDKIKYLEEETQNLQVHQEETNNSIETSPTLPMAPGIKTEQSIAMRSADSHVTESELDIAPLEMSRDKNGSVFHGTTSGMNLAFYLQKAVQDTPSIASSVSEKSTPASGDNGYKDISSKKKKDLSTNSKKEIDWSYIISNEDFGRMLLDTAFEDTMCRFPVVNKEDALAWHEKREYLLLTPELGRGELIPKVRLLLLYAIGLRLLLLSGVDNSEVTIPYTFVDFYSAARKDILVIIEIIDLDSIICLILTAVYMLRTSYGEEIWHLLSLAMRYNVELGLHRKEQQPIPREKLYESVIRRRVFWSTYSLERGICLHTGRPFSINDTDINVDMPYNINTSVKDPQELYELIYVHPELTNFTEVITDLSTFESILRIHKVEAAAQNGVYRVDKKLSTDELVREISKLYKMLDSWQYEIPKFQDEYTQLFMTLLYHRAMRILLMPLLQRDPNGVEDATDYSFLVSRCIQSCGSICLLAKRLIQFEGYSQSFIALNTLFLSALTLIYCVLSGKVKWSLEISTYLQSCSTALFVIGERMPSTKRYLRDPFEKFLEKTIEQMYRNQSIQRQKYELQKQHRTSSSSNQALVPTAPSFGNILYASPSTPLFATPFGVENVLNQDNLPFLGISTTQLPQQHLSVVSPSQDTQSHLTEFDDLWQMISDNKSINFDDQTAIDKVNFVLDQSFHYGKHQ